MECIWPLGAALGEGPLWHAGRLWFVDIKGGRIHCCDEGGGDRRSFPVGGAPSFIQPLAGGGFVIGNGHSLQCFDGERVIGEIAHLSLPGHTRFNDATVDPSGRLWFGSMDEGEQAPIGVVHVHDGDAISVAGGAAIVTNGPAISRDGRRIYHVDTVGGVIWRFAIDADAVLRDGERFVTIDPADGNPDGVTIDAEDHLWVGLWAGGATRRYAPDGSLAETVPLPCANVTKVAFGGEDLRTVFVTTARTGIDPVTLERQPLAGGLFAFRAAVPGIAAVPARLTS